MLLSPCDDFHDKAPPVFKCSVAQRPEAHEHPTFPSLSLTHRLVQILWIIWWDYILKRMSYSKFSNFYIEGHYCEIVPRVYRCSFLESAVHLYFCETLTSSFVYVQSCYLKSCYYPKFAVHSFMLLFTFFPTFGIGTVDTVHPPQCIWPFPHEWIICMFNHVRAIWPKHCNAIIKM